MTILKSRGKCPKKVRWDITISCDRQATLDLLKIDGNMYEK